MNFPDWALVIMWGATMVGTFYLTKEMIRRFT